MLGKKALKIKFSFLKYYQNSLVFICTLMRPNLTASQLIPQREIKIQYQTFFHTYKGKNDSILLL